MFISKVRLVGIAVIFALVAASCSSSDDAEVATAVAEAPAESATANPTATATATAAPTVAATPTAIAAPESDCGIQSLMDPEPGAETAETILRVVDGFSYCLRLPQAASNRDFTIFLDAITELYTSLLGEGTYTRLVETYGSEATLVLALAAINGFDAAKIDTSIEISYNFCSTVEDEFLNVSTMLYMLYAGVLSDEVLACVRQAPTSERQQAISDLVDTFDEEVIAKLIDLYGVEATIVIFSISRILTDHPDAGYPEESNCDEPELGFDPDAEITDLITDDFFADLIPILIDGLVLCFRQLPQAILSQEFAESIEFADVFLGEETHAKLIETYGSEAILVFTALYAYIAIINMYNTYIEDSQETVIPTEISNIFCSTVEDEFSNADTRPDMETLLDKVTVCVRQASTSEHQQAITDLVDIFGEEAITKVTELYGVEATIVIFNTFGIASSLFPLQGSILKS